MYLSWGEKILNKFDDQTIESSYDNGFVFTRIGKGIMNQTRSVRVDLSKFELSSENRRVLSRIGGLSFSIEAIPYQTYDWTIHKLGKEFYEKFGKKTFSAQKIKELITDQDKSNFNILIVYKLDDKLNIGYCIALETKNMLHYCYPFYNIGHGYTVPLGMNMMLQAIGWAKEQGKKYVFLGSAQRPTDTYKLQFSGLEWFDGDTWQDDLQELKSILKTA